MSLYHMTRFAERVRSILRNTDQLYRLGGDEFSLYFQPQYELNSQGEIFGFEALIRLGDGGWGRRIISD